jgi:hypothetical protein
MIIFAGGTQLYDMRHDETETWVLSKIYPDGSFNSSLNNV